MTRDLLHEAADDLATTSETVSDAAVSDRLASLATQLRSQAERNTTPALGTLDRVQHALQEVADDTDDEAVRQRIEAVREQIFSFLGTLDDRGMQQHGADEQTEPTDSP